jgi:hypothetical protein
MAIKQIEPSYSLSFTPKTYTIEGATEMGPDETYDDSQLNPPKRPTKEHLSTGIFNNIEINSNNEYYYKYLRHSD